MKIDSVVIVKSSSEVKKIVDVEIICGQKIFYMEDNTSYHENQLSSSSQDVKKLLSKKLETNKEKCDEIYREMIKEMVSNSLTFIKKNQYYQT
jgi:hypothetical protein